MGAWDICLFVGGMLVTALAVSLLVVAGDWLLGKCLDWLAAFINDEF